MTNTSTYTSWGNGFSPQKSTYHILGEDIEVEGAKSMEMINLICTLNVLGRPFYDELKKQNISISSDIEEHIERRLKILDRDLRINQILDDNKTKH
jgi:hypothetical protein